MASIGSLSSSTSNSIRGYGGLASGLDRDTLIESMTYATQSKITKQEREKTQLQWEQEAIRSISDKMVDFAEKYTGTLTSSSNLFSSVFWGRTDITASGDNSKYITVSGSASSAETLTILGVKQLAKNARWTSGSAVSDRTLQTGYIDPDSSQTVENLTGKSISIKFGTQEYTVYLNAADEDGNPYDYSTAEGIAKAINEQFANEELSNGIAGTYDKLGDVLSASVDSSGNLVFTNTSGGTNTVEISGGSALEYLGFEEGAVDGAVTSAGLENLTSEVSFAQSIAGKEITFSYNGTSKTIQMPAEADLTGIGGKAAMDRIAESLQSQLDSAFGAGRIEARVVAETDAGGLETGRYKLAFTTMNPATGTADESSTLSVTSASAGLLGEDGILGMKTGESNRLNLSAKLSESGLKLDGVDLSQGAKIKINGKEIEITADDTLNSLMNKINENTDVTMSYQSAADKFTFTSNAGGASGAIKFEVEGMDSADTEKLLNGLFGDGASEVDGSAAYRGTDAVVAVKFGGSDEVVELIRDSNSFTVDGMTIGLKGEFGYIEETDSSGQVVDKVLDTTAGTEVTFDAKANTDTIVETIKSMIADFNAIIDAVNTEVTTKPDRDFYPLSDDEKEGLTESEIETWEKKAKEGLLFNDSDLRNLSMDLGFIVNAGDLEALKEIGISMSSSYTDNGKLVLDETKLRAALETDPENVQNLFTKEDGLAENLQEVMDKYAKTVGATKGSLIERAGSTSSPLSLTTNSIYKEIEEINEVLATLRERLQTETDRWISQFTSLETLISEMNSQSSYLSSLSGY